jgi:GDP-L-fucose synthase
VTIWGSGTPLREFLYVDDMAAACLFLMQHYSAEAHINVGVGRDLSILSLAELVAKVVGYSGTITTDPTKPDGTPRKLMDITRISQLGWKASVALEEGIAMTYRWYCQQYPDPALTQAQ